MNSTASAWTQKEEGTRVIRRAHMLGFLDPDLPKRSEPGRPAEALS